MKGLLILVKSNKKHICQKLIFSPAECMQHNQEVPMIGVNSPEPQKESAAICTQSSLQENSELITSVTSDQIASVELTGVSDNNNLETYVEVVEKFPILDRINPTLPEALTNSMDDYSTRDIYADGFACIDQFLPWNVC